MVPKYPLVSVIIPTYNRFSHFLKCYKSIIDQTYNNLEIIVVDDCSHQKEYKKINNYLNAKNTQYIRHPNNSGHCAALNTGIKASKGIFIAFCDDDDIWLNNKIELQLKKYKDSPAFVGVISCSYIVKKSNEEYLKEVNINGWFHRKFIALGQPLGNTSTLLLTRKCINEIGLFDESLKRGIDGDYLFRVSLHFKALSVMTPLVIYNFEDNIKRTTDNITRRGVRKDVITKVRRLRSLKNIHGFKNLATIKLFLVLIKRLLILKRYRMILSLIRSILRIF